MSPARRSALRRWSVVVVAVALLAAVPSIVGALPVARSATPVGDLLARIRGSAGVAYSGYAESTGGLSLPAIPRLGGVDDLFSGTTRMRVWWAGPSRWRVDRLTVIGETDTYAAPGSTSVWESDDRRTTAISGASPVRLPRPADLLPADLGRRLAGAARPAEIGRLAAVRVAGRRAAGLLIRPADPATTVGAIRIWADPASGLPLRVDISGRGASRPTLRSSYLNLRLSRPAAALTRFVPPVDGSLESTDAPDIAAAIERFAPYALPARLAGLSRRPRAPGVGGTGGTATYGEGYTLVVLLPLPGRLGRSTLRSLGSPPARPVLIPGAEAAGVATPLVSALVVSAGGDTWLLAGTVALSTLVRGGRELVANPPPYRPDAP